MDNPSTFQLPPDTPRSAAPAHDAVASVIGQFMKGGTLDLAAAATPPPAEKPPETMVIPPPPAAQPPAAQPPAAQPPPAQPPAAQPPAAQPHAAQPPVAQPPAAQPPAAQPPAAFQPPSYAERYGAPAPTTPDITVPDIPAEQNIQLPQGAPETVGHAFAAARAETKKYRQLAESMQQQLLAVKNGNTEASKRESALLEKLTAEQNRAKDLEDRLGKVDLQSSPAFREKYDAPLQAVEAEITRVLVGCGIQNNDAMSLAREVITADPKDVPDLLRNLPTTTQGMIMYKAQEADNLWTARDNALKEWRSTQSGLQETAAKDMIVVSAQRRGELADLAIQRIALTVPVMAFNDADTVKIRDEVIAKGKDWFRQASEDQIAAAAFEGVLAPLAYARIAALEQQNSELLTALESRHRAAAPKVVPLFTGTTPPPAPAPAPSKEQTIADRVTTPVDASMDPMVAAHGFVSETLKGFNLGR